MSSGGAARRRSTSESTPGLRGDDRKRALRSVGGAHALGIEGYGLAPGAPADLVVVAASTPAEAVVTHPVRELVLKGGRVVAQHGRIV